MVKMMEPKNLIGKVQSRNILFATDNISVVDVDTRKVSVCFSSEAPVPRTFGNEILSHDPDSVDLTRLLSGAPVLVGHDADDQVGVVESAHIDPDRRGRATLRFGRSQRAIEIFNDIQDGIRQKISVGYIVNEYRANENGDFVAVSWQPLEISTVSIPADDTVGVGRSLESTTDEVNMSQENTTPAQPKVDMEAIKAEAIKSARSDEQKRVTTIMELAKRHQLVDMAQEFISAAKSVEEFRNAALEEVSKRSAQQTQSAPKTSIDMEKRDVERYSVMKAIRAMNTGNWEDAKLEQEASFAVADKLGRDTTGFFVPYDIQKRAQNTQVDSAGGALVSVDYRGGSFIDLLRARSVVVGLGANMLTGLKGSVDIPKQTGASTVYWIGEDEAATDSQITLGTVQLNPRTLANAVPITRRMLMQSDPSIDMLVMNDIAIQMALAMDIAILEGNGVGKPKGITATTGVNTQSVSSAGAPTYAELVGFETAIDSDNALTGNVAYVTTPTVKGNLKTTAKDSGSGIFLLDGGVANGYPVATTTQLSANRIIFGNFGDVIIGNWGVLEISEDRATKVASGGIVIRAFQDIDSVVRHPESFCINA